MALRVEPTTLWFKPKAVTSMPWLPQKGGCHQHSIQPPPWCWLRWLDWLLNFLTVSKPLGSHTSSAVVWNSEASEGCAFSSLFTLYTHDEFWCKACLCMTSSLTYIRGEQEINLYSIGKTKELIVGLKKKESQTLQSVYISVAEVVRMHNFRFLDFTISGSLS